MSSPLGSQQNVKVFVLYLMQNVGYPMDFVTINDIIMQTDYVAYLDFAESFSKLQDNGLIEECGTTPAGDPTYAITSKAVTVVESLRNTIPPSILEESLTCALRHLDFSRRGVKASCQITPCPHGGYDFHCSLTEKGNTLLDITLHVDTAARARNMENQFRNNPEHIYRAALALTEGKVNYLFDR